MPCLLPSANLSITRVMKLFPFFNNESFNIGRFSHLLRALFQNIEKSSSAEDLRDEITSPEFEEKIKLLVKNDLRKHYYSETIEQVLNKVSFIISNNEDEIIDDEIETEKESSRDKYIVADEKQDEIFKVYSRVPGWFQKPHQINSRILIAYMELLGDDNSVPQYKLESSCRSIKTFKNNYTQMKCFGEKNHAKVFEESGNRITLWEPVRGFVKKEYAQYIRVKG